MDIHGDPTEDLTNVFPPSLENLCLGDCYNLVPWAVERSLHLIDSKSLPNLTALRIEVRPDEELLALEDNQELLEILHQRCEQTGIAFCTQKTESLISFTCADELWP